MVVDPDRLEARVYELRELNIELDAIRSRLFKLGIILEEEIGEEFQLEFYKQILFEKLDCIRELIDTNEKVQEYLYEIIKILKPVPTSPTVGLLSELIK